MRNFYIFLDIDGVMYDWQFVIAETNAGRMQRGALIHKFKPESVEALNLLIQELEKDYNVGLVISSTWRMNMPFTVENLKENGVIYNKEIDSTPIFDDPEKRGEEIKSYLEDKEDYDFVIIDDEMFDYKEHFDEDKIIKCDMFNSALDVDKVEDFLSRTLGLVESKDETSIEEELVRDK